MKTRAARSPRSVESAPSPLVQGAGSRLDLIQFYAGFDERLAVQLVFGVDHHRVR